MDVYLDLGTGRFKIDYDKEDQLDDWKLRYMAVNAAARAPWPQLPGAPVRPGKTFEGQPYDNVISVDPLEHQVTTTLSDEQTTLLLKEVGKWFLGKVKHNEPTEEDIAANKAGTEPEEGTTELPPNEDDDQTAAYLESLGQSPVNPKA